MDVLTAQEDGSGRLADDLLLERAHALKRVLFTSDHRFRAEAEDWIRQGREFAGLIFGHLSHGVGPFVRDLEIIAKASEPDDWRNKVEWLPFT